MDCEKSRQATVAAVLSGLRRDILLGAYGDERQISEAEVANKYQVSRSSVRSAFQDLERDGLLEIQPNGRKILRNVDQKYIKDLCITRSILECEAGRLIMCQKKPDFSALLKIVGEFFSAQQMEHGSERSLRLSQLNEKFHDQMFVMAQNVSLMQCRRTIAPILSAIAELNATLDLKLNVHGYYEAHKKIAEMLMEKDPEVIEYIRYHAAEATLEDFILAIQKARDKNTENGERQKAVLS